MAAGQSYLFRPNLNLISSNLIQELDWFNHAERTKSLADRLGFIVVACH